MNYIEYFKKKPLLTDGKSNAKTAKNDTKTFYLSLQPATLNSKRENLCKFSTKECRSQCLQYAGRQGFSNVVESRSRKTEYFINHRNEFIVKLWNELVDLNRQNEKIAIRLNLLSDINWNDEFKKTGRNIASLSNIIFYDYTKDHLKIVSNNLKNYHLTYSFSGYNWNWCEKFLKEKKANVAVVFKNSIPLHYKGFKVINGDENDERFLNEKGVIIGLKYKQPKFSGILYEKNKFVIDE